MEKKSTSNVKLGAFVLGGLLFLVLLLYMIGKNEHLFGSTYELKATFSNAQGLVSGNNVRFAGIESGTVKKISIINDTLIEVTMLIEKKMKGIIRKNAVASIGTEGLVGNKVVNIIPGSETAAFAEEGDVLVSKKAISTDDMMQTLSKTNDDVAVIASGLKEVVQRINNSSALWDLLNEKSIPRDVKMSVANIRAATVKAGIMVNNLDAIVADIKNGKGSVGVLLKDTLFAKNLNEAVVKIKQVGDKADSLSMQLSNVVAGVQNDINNGKGTANALLKDTTLAAKLNASLDNIQKGTDGFNQNMEALKHNILFRGYFKKLEKQKAKAEKKAN